MYPASVDEVQLAEELIALDTSTHEGLEHALEVVRDRFVGARVPVEVREFEGRTCILARVGCGSTRVLFNAHVDVVPGHPEQFVPVRHDGRLYGRGAYDMKAALAAMMCAVTELNTCNLSQVTVEMLVVPDEERADPGANCSEMLVNDGFRTDFVICGEPTDLHVGVQAKGVVLLRCNVPGRAAHGSTPWLGENAVLRAVELFHRVCRLPFMHESSDMFPAPSASLGRIEGGTSLNSVPDLCRMYLDIRPLPGQDVDAILDAIRELDPEVDVEVLLARPAAYVSDHDPMVTALLDAVRPHADASRAVGRDGSSDAIPFIDVGIPAVEFGPVGAGHHGPDEFVEIASLSRYREALVDFVTRLDRSRCETSAA